MESHPPSDALRSYLSALRNRSTQEIEARKPVELESQDTPEVVPPLIDVTVSLSRSGITPESSVESPSPLIFTSLAEAFSHHAGRLVLLGRPGSGKTTTLWMFARERTDACLSDPTQPLPIFLKIDTWNRKTPIAEWVHSQMPDLPLENVPLLYLCDGLDELGGERPVDPKRPTGEHFDPRADFLRLAETQFVESQFVISCRSAEYEQIRAKMHGCGAVTLLPLDEAKIEEFLTSWDRPRLWEALSDDPNLMELARTPLLLSLLCSAVGNEGVDTEQNLRHLNESTLFRFYFDRRFTHEERKFQAQHPGASLPFDKPATQKLLGRLALYMWHWRYDPLTTLDRIEAQFHLGTQADAFLAFACRMHFLRESPDEHIAFIHLKFRDFCVIPALQQMLESESDEVWAATFGILLQLKEQGVPTLLQAAEQGTISVQSEACSYLAHLAAQTDPIFQEALVQVLPVLQRLLYSDNDRIRWAAIRDLLRSGPAAMHVLLQALQNGNTATRYTIASGIVHHSPRIAPELHEALEIAIPTLLEALKEDDPPVRRQAVAALLDLAQKADPLVFDSNSNRFRYVQKAAEGRDGEALQAEETPVALSSNPTDPWLCEALKQTVSALVEALREKDENLRREIVSVLLHQREHLLPDLLPALRDSDRRVCKTAAFLLVQSGVPMDAVVQDTLIRTLQTLLQAFDSREVETRRAAIEDILTIIPDTSPTAPLYREAFNQAVPTFLEAIHDSDEEIRCGALYALTRLGVSAVPLLLQDLQSRESKVRRQAASTLVQLTHDPNSPFCASFRQSVTLILVGLQSSDARVRRAAASLLTQTSNHDPLHTWEAPPEAIPALQQAIRHKNFWVRRAAVFMLIQSGAQSAPALKEALPQVVSILLQALMQEGDRNSRGAGAAYHRFINGQEPAYREACLQAMPAFLKVLSKNWLQVQREVASELALLDTPLLPVLMQALKEPDFRVRRVAVFILGELQEPLEDKFYQPSPQAFSGLLQALHDRKVPVRRAVVSILASCGARAIPALQEALRDNDARIQRQAVRSLAALITMEVPTIPLLLPLLQDSEARVRRETATALSNIGVPDYSSSHIMFEGPYLSPMEPELQEAFAPAIPALRQALQDRDAGVRQKILSLLARQGEQADRLLLEGLEDENLQVRRCAVEFLGERRTAIPALLRLLQADRHATRWAALAALYEHGYVPALSLWPWPHVTLRHRHGAPSSTAGRRLLKFQMWSSLLQWIPIRLFESEE